MFRRRQPALIASLASVAAAGLVAPAVAAGGPGQALVGPQAAAAGVVAPGVVAGAVVAETATMLATVAGEATSESTEPAAEGEVVEEPAAEPAPDPATEPPPTSEPAPTTTAPEPPPTTEPAPTTTAPATGETEPTTTTTAPVDEPTTDPTTTTTTTTLPAPADEPACETPTEPTAEATTEPTTTTSTPAPDDESACESTTPTTVAPEPETEPTTPTADAPDEEPAVDPPTDPTATTVPAPVDDPVEDVDDGEPATDPTSGDEPEAVDAPNDEAEAADEAETADEAEDGEPAEPVDLPGGPVAPTPIDTTPAELNTYDPGLRASSYDGVYAEGVPVGVAMATTRWLESGNRYNARARGSTASGAYQILDSTWQGYGGYPRAVHAPPEVQDQFAYEAFTALLKRHGNDVSTIPVSWYIGHVPQGEEWDTVPKPEAGNVLTPRQYQAKWMKKFFSLLSEGAPVYLPSDTEPLIPAIAFPVLGPVEFVDDWHFERDGGARRHEGLDFMGYEGQPVRAAFDGVVTLIKDVPSGIAGNGLRLTRDDGLYANYFHLSNSETGPVHSSLEVGTRVRAGQIIGFMGSTGNAGIPHLHFELRTPEREPMAPYAAALEAIQREQCTVGLGPWSTELTSPVEKAEAAAEALQVFAGLGDEQVGLLLEQAGPEAAALATFGGLTDEQVERLLGLAQAETAGLETFADLDDQQTKRLFDLAELAAEAAAEAEAAAAEAATEAEAEDGAEQVEYLTIEGPDGAQWVVGADGSVTASGQAAMIGTYQTDCPMPVETTDEHGDPIMYGTEAEGLAVDELPLGWWDDGAVEWTPDLDDDEAYVDPWELDEADLHVANENHVDHEDHEDQEDRLADRRSNGMI